MSSRKLEGGGWALSFNRVYPCTTNRSHILSLSALVFSFKRSCPVIITSPLSPHLFVNLAPLKGIRLLDHPLTPQPITPIMQPYSHFTEVHHRENRTLHILAFEDPFLPSFFRSRRMIRASLPSHLSRDHLRAPSAKMCRRLLS